MAEIEGLVRALREGDDAAKTAAARALGHRAVSIANKAAIAEAGGIPPLVELLRDGNADAKAPAAFALGRLAFSHNDNQVLIVAAGGIPSLVELLSNGSAEAKLKLEAAWALGHLAHTNANRILIAEAGGIPPLVELLRDGSTEATRWALWALRYLADNDANAVAIAAVAAAVGFDALVELARRGRVTVDKRHLVHNAALPAKRKAALLVAALLGGCVPDSVPRVLKAVIGSHL